MQPVALGFVWLYLRVELEKTPSVFSEYKRLVGGVFKRRFSFSVILNKRFQHYLQLRFCY